jgi:hypothetical protein
MEGSKTMRKFALAMLAVAVVAVPAMAELQNVQVGGEIRIRANYYSNLAYDGTGTQIVWPNFFLPRRAIGGNIPGAPFNGTGILSTLPFRDEGSHSLDFVEQRTRLAVRADFTNEVSAFIELDSYDIWGEDFRSDYITGLDNRAVSNDDVEIYQAYIQAENMWGFPLRMRVGRQEMSLGSEWLVGVNDAAAFFQGLSFDALRLDYATDLFSITAFASILAEGGSFGEQDDDTTFVGVYGSYTGLEDIVIDAYWLWLRDPRSLNDTNFIAPLEWIEDVFGLDDYDATNLHTFGLRGAGQIGAFDFEAEAAYQTGDAGQVGFLFKPFIYGDDDAEYDEWGANLELGYTFDIAWQPRVYVGGAYFGGEDNRDLTFWQWINPFDLPEASVSFNRLFSNWEYSEFITNTELSNAYVIRAGVSASPTESVDVLLALSYFNTLEEFDEPLNWNIGGFKIPVAPALSFLTQENDSELGYEAGLYVTYNYTEDLSFEVGWAHFFVGDGAEDGQFSGLNGLGFIGGSGGDDDSDYVYVETKIGF